MMYVVRYTIIAALCSVIFVPSVIAKEATTLQGDHRIKQSDNHASKLKTIRGRVIKSEEDSLTLEQVNGEETVLTIGPQTKTNHNFHPGDRITATVNHQGRAEVVHKEAKPKP